ncbi:MAG: hypothetical protein J0M08_06165 [Bacteroidetes bacterium]|nr:hypothetical protein [Bacteroidota bacterium]
MKKIISIFLLLQFLTNQTFAEELVKLPTLFIHFNHHAQEHKDVTGFYDFLKKHYSQKDQEHEQHDKNEHGNMPFNHDSNSCISSHSPISAYLPITLSTSFLNNIVVDQKYYLTDDQIKDSCFYSIWQPPKLG